MDEKLAELEKKQSEEDDSSELPPSDIVAYNELRSCADILRMYEKKQLIIQPDFQRDVVWLPADKTRFIDSLIKQLPIPSMCISLDHKSQTRLVIDGLQRISTIINFLDEKKEFKLSKLDDIDQRIAGKTNHQIREKENDLYEKVENLTIPITVLRCDYQRKNHMEYLFTIFHRLNTGGTRLTNQEIRNCLYYGNFNNLLKDLAKEKNYIEVFNIDLKKSYRFAHEEMILRFISFSKSFESYKGQLSKYLNDYMGSQKNITTTEIESIKDEFVTIFELVKNKITRSEDFNNLSKAILEALYVGIQRNLNTCLQKTPSELTSAFNTLLTDMLFSSDSLKEGLSKREKVNDRLKRSIEIFG